MELRQLRYFVAVAEEANFTRAAQRVHVAQPGISSQIRRLERELGQDLFDRTGRSVRLTEAGEAALPYARAAIAAAAGVGQVADELKGLLRGHVTVGSLSSISTDDVDIAEFLSSFQRSHPAIEISLTVATSEALVRALLGGELDLAVIGLGAEAYQGIDTHVIAEEQLVAVVHASHPLATRSTVSVRSLAKHRLISLPKGTGLRSRFDEACEAARIDPNIGLEAGDPRVLIQLARRSMGAAVVPESVAASMGAELHAVLIERPRLVGRIALAWRSPRPVNPAGQALLRTALAHASRAAAQ